MNKNQSPATVLGERMNKFFRYRKDSSIHKFLAFNINGSQVIYSTDQAVFTTSTANFFGEMADWSEVSQQEAPAAAAVSSYVPQLPALPSAMADNFEKMFATLNYAIEQTKKDKGFVDQANSINKMVQSGINLGRLQVDAYKTILGR